LAGPGAYGSRAFISSSLEFSVWVWARRRPCDRGGVREHPRARTRTGGTARATRPVLERVPASAGTDGAVHLRWTRRSQRHAARASASTRSAAAYGAAARSRPPIVRIRPAG